MKLISEEMYARIFAAKIVLPFFSRFFNKNVADSITELRNFEDVIALFVNYHWILSHVWGDKLGVEIVNILQFDQW